ncbi:hypothetical protein PC116_g27623 [Phytophthora cactorum]|nr:hypothetical protein PC116_g27623 [Phytophthora cactorum]
MWYSSSTSLIVHVALIFSPSISVWTSGCILPSSNSSTPGSTSRSHAPTSVFARKSCSLSAGNWYIFSTLIAFFKSSTESSSSTRTENALPATPTIAQKSFTIFPRAGEFWNEEEGGENFWTYLSGNEGVSHRLPPNDETPRVALFSTIPCGKKLPA